MFQEGRINLYINKHERRPIMTLDEPVQCIYPFLEDNRRLSHYFWHAMRGGRMLFTCRRWSNNSLCITTAQDAKSLCMMGSPTTYKEHHKNLTGAALNFLTQYKEDGNHLLEQISTGDESWIHFYKLEGKSTSMVSKKKRKKRKENSRMRGLPNRRC